jgi:hypothetical protein
MELPLGAFHEYFMQLLERFVSLKEDYFNGK